MIPSKPDLDWKAAKTLMLALAGGSTLQKREASLYCQKNGISVSELRGLARQVTGPAPATK